MSKKIAILGLAAVALIAVTAISYFGYTLTSSVDAANLGPVAHGRVAITTALESR